MADENIPRRIRGIFKNALVWGGMWGILGTAGSTLARLVDNIPLLNAIGDGIGMGIRIGIVGGFSGAIFASFIALAYRGRKLADISWVKFGLGALAFTGILVPGFLQTMNFLTDGHIIPWNLVFDDFIFSALFGGITAAGTMKLAQMDEAKNPVTVEQLLGQMEQQAISAGQAADFARAQRQKASEQRT